ncbi:MAG: hypothetical protein IPJ65_07200 [Archangiaceae bacterium]|nr:hypothetical protein [Archangiaceae bacterium]
MATATKPRAAVVAARLPAPAPNPVRHPLHELALALSAPPAAVDLAARLEGVDARLADLEGAVISAAIDAGATPLGSELEQLRCAVVGWHCRIAARRKQVAR